MEGIVKLNDKTYAATRIRQYPIDSQADAQVQTGEFLRSANKRLTSAVYSDWVDWGMFHRRMRRHQGLGGALIAKSTVETCFAEYVHQMLLEEAQTHASPKDFLREYISYKGSFYAAFEQKYATTAKIAGIAKFNASTDTWDGLYFPTIISEDEDQQQSQTTHAFDSDYSASTLPNRLYLLGVFNAHNTDTAISGTPTIDSQSTTLAVTSVIAGTPDVRVSWYYYVDTGTNVSGNITCSVTFSTAQSVSSMTIYEIAYCDPSDPIGSTDAESTGSGSSKTSTITPETVGGLLVTGIVAESASVSSFTDDASSTGLSSVLSTTAGGDLDVSYQRAVNTSSHDIDYQWAGTTSSNMAIATVELRATGAINNAGGHNGTNAEGLRIFSMIQHRGRLVVFGSKGNGAEEDYEWYYSTDGLSFTAGAGTGWPTANYLTTTVTRRNNWDDRHALGLDDGGAMLVALYEDSSSSGGDTDQIRIYRSADNGANWTNVVNVPSSAPAEGLHRFRNPYDSDFAAAPALVTREGVYIIDVSGTNAILIYGMSGQDGDGKGNALTDNGDLRIGTSSGDTIDLVVGRLGRNLTIISQGPATSKLDGVPTEWRGHANYMLTASSNGSLPSPWLWMAYGGNASGKSATVMVFDYARSERNNRPIWHCRQDAQLNAISGVATNVDFIRLGLSSASDGTPRLHVAAEGTNGSLMWHIEEPLISHPAAGITGKYQKTGKLRFAVDDHGDPHLPGALYGAKIDAEELGSSSQEDITWQYGVGTGDWEDSTGGIFVSGDLDLELASGAGVSAAITMSQLNFDRRTTDTERALMREFEVLYRKKTKTLSGWEVTVDLDKSAEYQGATDAEGVIANLDTVQSSAISVKWEVGGLTATYVDMEGGVSYELSLAVPGGGDQSSLGRRSGTATFRIEEVQKQ